MPDRMVCRLNKMNTYKINNRTSYMLNKCYYRCYDLFTSISASSFSSWRLAIRLFVVLRVTLQHSSYNGKKYGESLHFKQILSFR